MDRKEIKPSTFFKLLRKQKPFWGFAIVFLSLGLFVFTPAIICLSLLLKEPYENYNYNKILKEGNATIAKVVEVKSVQNVTINGQNPKIIKYTYDENGHTITDNFKTIQTNTIKTGDEIKVSVLNNQSIIEGLEQFSFPFRMFFMGPIIFSIFGLVALTLGFIPAYKQFRLYKYGLLADANIISIIRSSGLPITNFGEKVIIDYSFKTDNHEQKIGKSSTTDFSVLSKYKVGDNIKIFYSDNDNSDNCIVPTDLLNII